MDEIGGLVLFPLENGKFELRNIIVGKTYEVHREVVSMSVSEATSRSPVTSSPFGAYTGCSCPDLPPHPPRSKNAKIKKTITVVSLSKKGKGKERLRLDYTTVTK